MKHPGLFLALMLSVSASAAATTVQISVTGPQSGSTYYVGDSYTFTVTGAANAAVSVTSNGTNYPEGTTNSSGVYTLSGSWSSGAVGSYTQTWYVAGVAAPTYTVTIKSLPTPTVSWSVTGPQSGSTYYAGDSYTVTVTGAPNASVYCISNGAKYVYANTNSSGVFTLSGTWPSGTNGSYTQTWYVANVAGATYTLSVLALPTPTVQISVTGPQSGSTYYVGDSYTFTVTGAPNASVSVVSNGTPTQYSNTNSSGVFTLSGTWPPQSIVGSYTQTWYVANVAATTYTLTLAPVINGLSLTQGPAQMGFVIYGGGFGNSQGTGSSASTVKVNGATVTTIPASNWTPASITVQVPPSASVGTGTVVVTVNGVPSNGYAFAVTSGFGCSNQ